VSNTPAPNQTLIMPQSFTNSLGEGATAEQDAAKIEARFKSFHHYEVEKKLGEGGMGSIYKARQKNLNRTVALKVLPQRLSDHQRYTARLLREAQVLAKINHPNVITCYDVGEHEQRLFVVMEFVEGESLYELIKRRERITIDEALSYVKQAVLGLDHASAVGVIHRDIKPENLLLSTARPQGTTIPAQAFHTLKIADLGLAAYTDESQQNTRLTVEGSALGSPYYMSPEQTLGEQSLDTRTDIYALGITLYQMVTGKTPYEAQSIAAILAKKLSETIPDPRAVRNELPASLSLLLQRMTARKKEDRYASYGDLLRDIEALEQKQPLATEVLPAERGSVLLLPETLALLGSPLPQAGPRMGAARNMRSGVLMTAAVGGALLLLFILYSLIGRNTGTPEKLPVSGQLSQPVPPENLPPKDQPSEVPVPRFEPLALLEGKSKQGWASTGEKHIFGYEIEDDALSLQAPTPHWSHAERELPVPEFRIDGSMKIVQGADECEVRIKTSDTTYAALGIRFPLHAKNVTAYLETRTTATNAVLKLENSQEGFDPDAWFEMRMQNWDGQVVCFMNNIPFGASELTTQPLKGGTVRIAVRNGIGLFRNLWVLPRPTPKGKP